MASYGSHAHTGSPEGGTKAETLLSWRHSDSTVAIWQFLLCLLGRSLAGMGQVAQFLRTPPVQQHEKYFQASHRTLKGSQRLHEGSRRL